MHDESAHLPETLNNETAKGSLHKFAGSSPSFRHWTMRLVPKGRVDSNGDMVHIYARTKAPRSLHIVQSTGLDFIYLLAFAFSRVH